MLLIVSITPETCDSTERRIITEQDKPSISAISLFFGRSATMIITVTTASTQTDSIFILKTEELFYRCEQRAYLGYDKR